MRCFIVFVLFLSLSLNAQNFNWANKVNGAYNTAIDVAVDSNDNTYIFGSFSSGVFDDITGSISLGNSNEVTFEEFDGLYVAKYNTTGDLIWAEPIYENVYAGENAISIALDSSNNIYIVGNYYGSLVFDKNGPEETIITDPNNTNTDDVFIAKYDSDGNFIWVKEITGENLDKAVEMVVDDFDNILITGFFGVNIDLDPSTNTDIKTSQGQYDTFVAKYDSDGNYIFGKVYGDSSFDEPRSITAYPNGDVLVSGQFGGTVDFDQGTSENVLTSFGAYDNVLVRYNSVGEIVWLKQLASQSALASGIFAVKLDSQLNIILTGNFSGIEDFDPDPNNDVELSSLNNGHDAYLLKLNSLGEFLWVNQLSGTNFDYARSLVLDDLDNMYVGGIYSGDLSEELSNNETFTSTSSAGSFDNFIWKVDSSGDSSYVNVFGGTGTEFTNGIQFNDGKIIVVGSFNSTVDFNLSEDVFNLSTSDDANANSFILKLEDDDSLSLNDFNFNENIQLFPNPSIDKFYFSDLSNTEGVEVIVYNTLGEIVSSNVECHESSCSFEIKNSKGVYFVSLLNKEKQKIKTFKVFKL